MQSENTDNFKLLENKYSMYVQLRDTKVHMCGFYAVSYTLWLYFLVCALPAQRYKAKKKKKKHYTQD